jgi:hypothetical protein
VLGMHEGNLRSWVIGVFLNCSEVTGPDPFFYLEEFGNLPCFPNPRLPNSPLDALVVSKLSK